jgi:hypothetical protein
MNEFLENLKKEASANPLVALGLAAALLTAAGKFIDATGSIKSKRAFAKMAQNAAKKSKK